METGDIFIELKEKRPRVPRVQEHILVLIVGSLAGRFDVAMLQAYSVCHMSRILGCS